MINIDGKIFRNIQQQVLKNQLDIANLIEVNKVGIKVIGVVDSASKLPDPATTTGLSYGDTFLVGTLSNYNLYVFTRPFVEGQTAQWVNIGSVGVQGPQGETGPQGPQGPQGVSARWIVDYVNPISASGYNVGDVWLNISDGSVFNIINNAWVRKGSIQGLQGPQGPQGIQGPEGPVGPQGPQGPTGDAGSFINIRGILTNRDQLPSPTLLGNLSYAYFIGTEEPYDLYVQVGEHISSAVWVNTGPFNSATLVYRDGQAVLSWDSDTKLDKKTNATDFEEAYVKSADGTQQLNIPISYPVNANTIVKRTSDGTVRTNSPNHHLDAVNRQYAEDLSYGNIFDGLNPSANYYINSSGNLVSYSTYNVSDYIETKGKSKLYFYNIDGIVIAQGSYINFYDSNKNIISTIAQENSEEFEISIPNNAKYFRFTYTNNSAYGTCVSFAICSIRPKFVLLWNNNNPNSSFQAQTISIGNLSSYKYLIFEFKTAYGYNSPQVFKFKNIAQNYMYFSWVDASVNDNYSRVGLIKNNNSIEFLHGSTNGSTNEAIGIPISIYGTNEL